MITATIAAIVMVIFGTMAGTAIAAVFLKIGGEDIADT